MKPSVSSEMSDVNSCPRRSVSGGLIEAVAVLRKYEMTYTLLVIDIHRYEVNGVVCSQI